MAAARMTRNETRRHHQRRLSKAAHEKSMATLA